MEPSFTTHSGLLNRSDLNLNMTRRLTNQDAFDAAMLHLLNQGHSCVSASGHARYRGPRGKSAIGALIPDELYVTSIEGKKVRHWLAAHGSEYDALRERLGSVTPALLDELQDLHDRIGACMPSLYRHLAVAGAQRIAQSFKLSMRLVNRCATYQYLRGPQIVSTVSPRAIPAAARAVEVAPAADLATAGNIAPTPDLAAARNIAPTPDLATARNIAPTPDLAAARNIAPAPDLAAARNITPAADLATARDVAPAPDLAAARNVAPTHDLAAARDVASVPDGLAAAPNVAPTPDLAAPRDVAPTPAPTPTREPMQLAESSQNDLDLIARGIARAIAAARPRSA
jgi:hypothetical protein